MLARSTFVAALVHLLVLMMHSHGFLLEVFPAETTITHLPGQVEQNRKRQQSEHDESLFVSTTSLATKPGHQLHQSSMIWLARNNDVPKLDRVVRVLEDGSIKLKENGVVTLEGVKIPKTNQGFPSCLSFTPVSKLSQILPAKTIVRVDNLSSTKSVVLTRDSDLVVVNERIIELGYAKASSKSGSSLKTLEESARKNNKGIYQTCEDSFDATFDPLQIPAERPQPRNPGDRVGCSDFTVYEDALKYYETYFNLYGDVARLDRNGDGIPCPGLPHTMNAELYRIKKPTQRSR